MLGREPAQRGCGRVGVDGQPAPPEALDLVFYGHGGQDLAERTPSGTAGFGGSSGSGVGRFHPGDERLVHLDVADESLPTGLHHGTAVPVQHRPCGLVGAEPEQPVQGRRRHGILPSGHVPGGDELHGQRCASTVEDRPRRDRHTPTARLAPPTAVRRSLSPPHLGQPNPFGQRSHSG